MSNRVKLISGEQDGASAVAHELDTIASLATQGANLFVVRNGTVEKVAMDKDGVISAPNLKTVTPAEGVAALNTALAELNAAGGGVLQLQAGVYDLGATGLTQFEANNITIRGLGDATVLKITAAPYAISFYAGTPTGSPALDAFVGKATSIFTSTPVDAAPFLEGYIVNIEGIESVSGDTDYEYAIVVADGNDITGEIQLDRPVCKSFDSANAIGSGGVSSNTIENLKIEVFGAGTYAINITNGSHTKIRNVTIEFDDAATVDNAISLNSGGGFNTIENCKFINCPSGSCVGLSGRQVCNYVKDNFVHYHNRTGAVSSGLIVSSGFSDMFILRNKMSTTVASNSGGGLRIDAAAARIIIKDNIFNDTNEIGMWLRCRDIIVHGNHFSYSGSGAGGMAIQSVETRNLIVGNSIFKAASGIEMGGAGSAHCIIAKNRIEECTEIGIYNAGDLVVIADNMIQNAGTIGINLHAIATFNSVLGNRVDGAGTGYGISAAGAPNQIIAGNIVNDTGSWGIRSEGLFGIVAGNIIDTTISYGIAQIGAVDHIVANNITRNATLFGYATSDPASPKNSHLIVVENNFRGEGISSPGVGEGKDFINNKE